MGAFKWTTNFNVGYNKNTVGNIGGQIIESGDQLQRAIDGAPIGTWYMQKFAGVDPATGDALYWDATGKTKTNDYEQAGRFNQLGKYTPDYTIGFTNTFSYSSFDLSVFFYAVTGDKLYNSAGTFQSDGFANFNLDNQTVDELNTWTHPGQITNTPRAGFYFGSGGHNSTQYLYDGSYIRLKNLMLGYNLPKAVSNALKISSARLYVSGTNMFTWTKYPGRSRSQHQSRQHGWRRRRLLYHPAAQNIYRRPQCQVLTDYHPNKKIMKAKYSIGFTSPSFS